MNNTTRRILELNEYGQTKSLRIEFNLLSQCQLNIPQIQSKPVTNKFAHHTCKLCVQTQYQCNSAHRKHFRFSWSRRGGLQHPPHSIHASYVGTRQISFQLQFSPQTTAHHTAGWVLIDFRPHTKHQTPTRTRPHTKIGVNV